MKAQDIHYLVLHCSATKETQSYSLSQLEQDHRSRGFRSVGYHYYVRRSGEIISLRAHNEVGAHCLGHNRESLGICYEGGLNSKGIPSDTRTESQKDSLWHLLSMLHKLYPQSEVVGHRDLSPDRNRDGKIDPSEWVKQCPCFDAKSEYKVISENRSTALSQANGSKGRKGVHHG